MNYTVSSIPPLAKALPRRLCFFSGLFTTVRLTNYKACLTNMKLTHMCLGKTLPRKLCFFSSRLIKYFLGAICLPPIYLCCTLFIECFLPPLANHRSFGPLAHESPPYLNAWLCSLSLTAFITIPLSLIPFTPSLSPRLFGPFLASISWPVFIDPSHQCFTHSPNQFL